MLKKLQEKLLLVVLLLMASTPVHAAIEMPESIDLANVEKGAGLMLVFLAAYFGIKKLIGMFGR